MRITPLILCCACLPGLAKPPLLPFYQKASRYRAISMGEQIPPGDTWKAALAPELGVGNVIFGEDELLFDKEDTYKVVTTARLDQLKTLWARAYRPGTLESIIRHLQATNPGYTFVRIQKHLQISGPDFTSDATGLNARPTLEWDSTRDDLLPRTNWNLQLATWLADPRNRPGNYRLRIAELALFNTGRTKRVTYVDRGQVVTEDQMQQTLVLLSYGAMTLVK